MKHFVKKLTIIFILFFGLFSHADEINKKIKVIHSSDAGADDFVTSLVLALDSTVNLNNIIITNADCSPAHALSAYQKFVQMIKKDISVGLSSSRVFHQFPWHWKADTIRMNEIDTFKGIHTKPSLSFTGDQQFKMALEKAAPKEFTIVATGPLSTLADLLKSSPDLKEKINSLYWMGGAINTGGNLLDAKINQQAINKNAEWNVFADAFAADWIFKNTTFPIYLIPLDLTNEAIISPYFLNGLKNQYRQGSKNAGFILNAYKTVCDLNIYYMWDVVTAAVLTRPDLFEKPVKLKLKVEISHENHGTIVKNDKGRNVHTFFHFKDKDVKPFHDYLLELSKKSSSI